MTRLLECDSLGFLSVDGLYHAMGENGRNKNQPQFSDHFFTGDYPTPLSDLEESRLEKQKDDNLSLLANQ
jgi:amidophosphoribosyltransferase